MTFGGKVQPTADGVSKASSHTVVIHVIDEYRKRSKKFRCPRDLLLTKMKYFQTYLNEANDHDEIDISVHCDIEIFVLLMEYMHQRDHEWQSLITLDNVASILVSSEFLQMEELVQECISYISGCLQDFTLLRVNFGCLSDSIITKIAEKCTLEQLQALHDPKDKILSKLLQKKVEALVNTVQSGGRKLKLCINCELLFLENDRNDVGCRKGKRQIGVHGELMGRHKAKVGWQAETFLHELQSDNNISWSAAFWYILGSIEYFRCSVCKQTCSLLELRDCAYHPGSSIQHSPASTYSCCGAPRFSADEILMRGCRTTVHTLIHSDRNARVTGFLNSVSLVNLWEQISACGKVAMLQGPSLSGEAVDDGTIDAASLFLSPQPSNAIATAIKCEVSSKKYVGESGNLSYRKQCQVLQIQEKDCVRCLEIARQLVKQRENPFK